MTSTRPSRPPLEQQKRIKGAAARAKADCTRPQRRAETGRRAHARHQKP